MTDTRPKNQAEAEALVQKFLGTVIPTHPGSFETNFNINLVELNFAEQSLTLSFETAQWTGNPLGVVHGGAVSGASDITMGILTYILDGGRIPPTITLQTTFLRPAVLDGRMVVKAVAHSVGKTSAAITCELWMANKPEKLCATATGTYFTAGQTYEEMMGIN